MTIKMPFENLEWMFVSKILKTVRDIEKEEIKVHVIDV